MNYPVWKYHPEQERVLVHDMVQDAILGPDWSVNPPNSVEVIEVPEKRKPGRPKKA